MSERTPVSLEVWLEINESFICYKCLNDAKGELKANGKSVYLCTDHIKDLMEHMKDAEIRE